jgi:hypothetical protein
MMQNVMTDKKEWRRQAIEKHAPRSEYTIKELKERIEQYFEDSYSVERLFTILAFLKRENILVTGINNETE